MSKKHRELCLHLYKRVNLSRKKDEPFLVYKCIRIACGHWVRLDLAEGKLCECHRCGETLVLTKAVLALNLAMPHHIECVKSKKVDDAKNLAEILKNI